MKKILAFVYAVFSRTYPSPSKFRIIFQVQPYLMQVLKKSRVGIGFK